MTNSELFSMQARQALVIAQTEAEKLGHARVEAEHMLLGIAGVPESTAALSLRTHNVTPRRIRALVESGLPRGDREHPATPVLGDSAKMVVATAAGIARSQDNLYVRTEHVLEAILDVGGEIGEVLKALGLQTRAERLADAFDLSTEDGVQDTPGELPVDTQQFRSQSGHPGPIRRYDLALPEGLYQQVQQLAEREQTTVVEVLQRFIRLGLLLDPVLQSPEASVIIREGEQEREIVVI